jgi:dihydroflavonol-4-reductase
LLRGRLPVLPRGRLSVVDVRDVAAAHAAVLRLGRGARRHLLAGPVVEIADVAAVLGELTGRRLRQRTAPDWLLRGGSRLADRAQRLVPARLPVSAEQMALVTNVRAGIVVDDTPAREGLAFERPEQRETLSDSVRWLAARGHVTARQAGALAGLTRPRPARPRWPIAQFGTCRRAAVPPSSLTGKYGHLSDRRRSGSA